MFLKFVYEEYTNKWKKISKQNSFWLSGDNWRTFTIIHFSKHNKKREKIQLKQKWFGASSIFFAWFIQSSTYERSQRSMDLYIFKFSTNLLRTSQETNLTIRNIFRPTNKLMFQTSLWTSTDQNRNERENKNNKINRMTHVAQHRRSSALRSTNPRENRCRFTWAKSLAR